MQYFCLCGILPFSKSYPEIKSTWPTAKCRRRKSCDTWYYIVTCATLCVSFSSKSKAINVFPKHSEIKSTLPIKSSKEEIVLPRDSKELFEQRLVKVLIKIESTLRCEIKEQAPQMLYRGRTVRSSHRRCGIRKLFLNILQHPQETALLESIFKKFGDL